MTHHGESGRIVVDVDPKLKRRLYAALSLSGSTLRDWFMKVADSFAEKQSQPSLFPEMTSGKAKTKTPTVATKGDAEFTVVSMFSGCGGMDLGFRGGFEVFGRRYDELPFRIVWANDNSSAACQTYRRNLGDEIVCEDVWKVMDSLPERADVLIGGFPCQDISVNGKRRGANGPRSGLYRAMVEAIRRVKPKVFVAENVKGLLMRYNAASLRQVLEDFRSLGYEVQYQLYKAADYGVPQSRERVLFVGTRGGTDFVPPEPERSPANWMTAKEAVSDLESMEPRPEINHIWSLANRSPEQGNRRLLADRPAYTIRAECHGNIQFHYKLPRRVSMREAARFQSFPDSFVFESKLRETERQVGNAVPPVLAWHIARAVAKSLQG